MSGGAPHIILRQVLAVTLGGVLQQRDGGGLQSAQFCQENTTQPPNIVNTGRLILNIVILASEQRNFQKFILVKTTWVYEIINYTDSIETCLRLPSSAGKCKKLYRLINLNMVLRVLTEKVLTE